MHLITICLLFLTVSIRVENKYNSEYTQKSKKLIIYAGLATLCQTHLFTIKYDGNLPPVQLFHPHSNTTLRIQYVTVLFVAGKIAVGPWINGKSVSSAVFKNTWMYKSTQQYAPTYFDFCTTIVQLLYNYCTTETLWHSRARDLNSGRFISCCQKWLFLKMTVIISCTIQAYTPKIKCTDSQRIFVFWMDISTKTDNFPEQH